MKFILILSVTVMSFTSLAEVPSVVARDATCHELKVMLTNYGSLKIHKGFSIFMISKTVQREAFCDADHYVAEAKFRTKDKKVCFVGEYCKRTPVPFDPTARCVPEGCF